MRRWVSSGISWGGGGVLTRLTLLFLQDVAAYRAKGGSGKIDAGKKSGPGRPPAKKAEPVDDDDEEEDEDEDEEDDEEDDDDE